MLPDLDWGYAEGEEPNEDKSYRYETYKVPQDMAEDFVEQLKVAGYTLCKEKVNADEYGNKYYWTFSNDVTEGEARITYFSQNGFWAIRIEGDF